MKYYLLVITFISFACSTTKQEVNNRPATTVIIKQGVENDQLTQDWLNTLITRESKEYIDSLSKLSRPYTEEEFDWLKLMQSRTTEWNAIRDSINAPFGDIEISDSIYVLLGYRGVDDGFTYQHQTICFDITALQRAYGSALKPVNTNRIDRLFAHEYTHLLSKKWMKDNNWEAKTFRDNILWECWYEGFGMYRSMSAKWFPVGDSLSIISNETFQTLYPMFVEKMVTMDTSSTLTNDQREWIQHSLSSGSMKKKWGALPVGVWLAMEAKGNDENLQYWLNKGPEGVPELALKHLPEKYRKPFEEYYGKK